MKRIYTQFALEGSLKTLGANLWNEKAGAAVRACTNREDELGAAARVLFDEILPELENFVEQKIAKETGRGVEKSPDAPSTPPCDLCHDKEGNPEEKYLRSRCHMTAPLQASLKEGRLTLRCYVPECAREVAVFKVEG